MNPTSRALLQTVLTTDGTVTSAERQALQDALTGETTLSEPIPGPLLVSQKEAAVLLGISRVTVWRMTKDGLLHPVELLPGTLRYHYAELVTLARHGIRRSQPGVSEVASQPS
jgi:hypothetical protein